jgi:hypothetical protein
MPKSSGKDSPDLEQNARSKANKKDPLKILIEQVSDELDADIVLLNADLERGIDNRFIAGIKRAKQHQNLMLILVTNGGDADVAYRIARYAQNNYEKFIVFVSGYCKSAGTLCVLGAHEIIMCDQGELGPLDVQFFKKDDLGETNSGLVIEEALNSLQYKAFAMFERNMMAIKSKSRGQISFRLATEIATKISVGLFEPIIRQIDPVMLGDVGRSMAIAKAYGARLKIEGKNLCEGSLDILVDTYPSHGFVIDRRDAEKLFLNIKKPTNEEELLVQILEPKSRFPFHNDYVLDFLSYKEQNTKETRNGRETSAESVANQSKNKGDNRAANDRGYTRSSETPKQSIPKKKAKPSS